tara:strand:+ start:24384 stop:25385 length:1002 start_codon:yes stop_codon:yes gene_type:complete
MTLLAKNDKIFLTGHKGLVGSAFKKEIEKTIISKKSNWSLITEDRENLDLRKKDEVENFFESQKPDVVIIAAAKVGGINANSKNNSLFLLENLQIQNNLIQTSFETGVQRLLFLGSSCIYPKHAQQPFKEESLLNGILEPTNEGYALAKICGLKLCQFLRVEHNFDAISVMPPNLYGPNDNFSKNNGHVIPGLLRKFHEAKVFDHEMVKCWGSGKPRREFMYVEDLVKCCIYLLESWNPKEFNSSSRDLSFINIGTGEDISIYDLAYLIKKIVGYQGKIIWDKSMPDGSNQKLLDVERLKDIGWIHSTQLKDGLQKTYQAFLKDYDSNSMRDL